ncbi:MAG: hypothetical protein HZC42_04970 [Candidatus Eisenbacteria bacterium]|nr:hypothetical protein [Candidatus Eisenbacteria bacterium]
MGAPRARTELGTLPLTVSNMGFLLDRLGKDCHPLQFLRELNQNAIEAIQRVPEKTGEIVWDVDWTAYELEGVYRLSIVDNGDGMSGEEMVKYINQLSSSFAKQSLDGNYGVGAKIAAATRNHAGLVYLSWKNGQGAMIHLWRDPRTGEYGLRQFERPDGSYGHYAPVEDTVKPDLIVDHGTMAILFGNAPTENTMNAPEGAMSPSRWVARYLNSRYFEFPEGMTVRAREGWENPRSDKDRNLLRRLTGQADYLRAHTESSGRVPLTNATARWWILKDEPALAQNSGFIESSGHMAALYQGEMYDQASARTGMTRLQQFGVILGHRRVVIYLEPQAAEGFRITTNTARTHLLVNNEPLPWAEWAAEFRDSLPDEIEALIEEVAAHSASTDLSQSVRDRLRDILDLYRVSRYRATPTGDVLIDEARRIRGGSPQRQGGSSGDGRGRPGGLGGTAGGVYSVFMKKEGTPGRSVQADPFPQVMWVSAKDGTREPGDMEDRAGRFLLDQNRLLINADFRAFVDMTERWTKQYEDKPGIREVVEQSVRSWFEQALVETVLGVQALKDSKEWTIEDVQSALSEEGLSAAVMSRYHVNNCVKRELGTKLGKLQTA